MTASKIFLYFCLSFVGGIFLSSFVTPHLLYLGGGLILGLILISVLWQYKKFVIVGFCLLFLVAGIWRHQMVEIRSTKSEIRNYNDREEIITLIGVVAQEPDIREKSQKLTINTKQLTINNQQLTINEKVLVTTNRYPEYQYGDKLRIVGKLKTPQTFEDFNYKDYLKKDGIYSVMDWPKIELIDTSTQLSVNPEQFGPELTAEGLAEWIEKNQGNQIYGKILDFKEKLRESIFQNLSPPQSSILGAMILGDKRKISEEWKQKLNITGVRHITAISGLHITVLTVILMSFLIWLGFWRQQAFYFTIILITLFILMTGLQPSAIRAGIMGGLFLLAQHLGRLSASSRAIVFAGAMMLAQNPLLLRLDVGFQLSFLAMLGIIYLSAIFKNWLKFIPWQEPRSILAMTFSAYLFTLPILIYNFGYISFIAPLANILIVPLLYWVMIFGFIFGLAGMILPILGWILSFPAWLLLTYLIKVVDWFSQIPFAYKTLEISWIWLIISYLILAFLTRRLQEKFNRPIFPR